LGCQQEKISHHQQACRTGKSPETDYDAEYEGNVSAENCINEPPGPFPYDNEKDRLSQGKAQQQQNVPCQVSQLHEISQKGYARENNNGYNVSDQEEFLSENQFRRIFLIGE